MSPRLAIAFNLEKGRCPIRTWILYISSWSSFSGLSFSTDSPGKLVRAWKFIFVIPCVALDHAMPDVTPDVSPDVAPDVTLDVVRDVVWSPLVDSSESLS
jgi:hypothetical protein